MKKRSIKTGSFATLQLKKITLITSTNQIVNDALTMYLSRMSISFETIYLFLTCYIAYRFSGLLIRTTCELLLYSQLNKAEFCIDSKNKNKKKEKYAGVNLFYSTRTSKIKLSVNQNNKEKKRDSDKRLAGKRLVKPVFFKNAPAQRFVTLTFHTRLSSRFLSTFFEKILIIQHFAVPRSFLPLSFFLLSFLPSL